MIAMELKSYAVGGDRLLRQCFLQLLGSEFHIIGESASIAAFLEEELHEAPHVVLWLDMDGDRGAEIDLIPRLRRRWPLTRIILLTRSRQTPADMKAVFDGTLDAVLSLDMNVSGLSHALGVVLLGGRIVSAELLECGDEPQNEERPVGRKGTGDEPRLSPRQRQILEAITNGLSNKEIARLLNVSEATVKVQVRIILSKIGVANRTQAAVWARAQLSSLQPALMPSNPVQARPTSLDAASRLAFA